MASDGERVGFYSPRDSEVDKIDLKRDVFAITCCAKGKFRDSENAARGAPIGGATPAARAVAGRA